MIVAGLDGATTSGLAIMDGERLLHWEAHRPRGKEDAEIFHGFRMWLRPTLVSFGVEFLAMEEPLPTNLERTEIVFSQSDAFSSKARKIKKPMSSMGTYRRLYGLAGHAREIAFDLNIPCEEVNQREWRQAFLGVRGAPKGTSDASAWLKDRAVQQCLRLGYDVKKKDAAEAVGIAFWGQGHLKLADAGIRPGDLFARTA
ncbi:hypothetical protein [Azorhizobium doebereinerae]|uniref:hypothetical protein n=1 Tax=Azorhizobium doebereinerae TaxID=281091 RepID=UPI00041CAB14|nr:hypothetical protein [Azorhizobium doebereinerae]